MQFDIAALPMLLTPRQVSRILGPTAPVLKRLPIPTVPMPTRGEGIRKHVRYRLDDVLAFARCQGIAL